MAPASIELAVGFAIENSAPMEFTVKLPLPAIVNAPLARNFELSLLTIKSPLPVFVNAPSTSNAPWKITAKEPPSCT